MWQMTAICLGILVGVAVAQWVNTFTHWAWPVIACTLVVAGMIYARRLTLVAMVLAGAMVGLWRGSSTQQDMALYRPLFGQHITVTGIVSDDPDTNRNNKLVLSLNSISVRGVSIPGKIRVTTQGQVLVQRSDRVTIEGKLASGFGSVAAISNNASIVRIQREEPGDIALAVRNDFARHVELSIHGPAASLGIGYLLGQKRGLPQDLVTALKVAGLTHIVVASGYNLTVLVRLARRLFEKVSKFLSAFTGFLMIGGFMAITGLSPSMSRAGLVSALALWAWYYGRRFHPITLLGLAGAITVLINPSYIWGDLGWELSFAAFAGVMIVAPLAHSYFYGDTTPHAIPQILIETISAQIVTAPIILMAFGQLSNIAPLANLLIVPFVPLAMMLVFVAGIGSYVVPAFASVVGWPAQIVLDAMIWAVNWCANQTWAQSSLSLQWWGVALWYALLAVMCWYMWRVTHYRFYRSSIVD